MFAAENQGQEAGTAAVGGSFKSQAMAFEQIKAAVAQAVTLAHLQE